MTYDLQCLRTIGFSDTLVDAVVRNAIWQADLTAAVLKASGVYNSATQVQFPPNFLLEMCAVLQIGVWERQNLANRLNGLLPSFAQVSSQLAARAAKGPAEFDCSDSLDLSRLVHRVWVENFAWNAQELIQSDVLVGDVDEDAFVEVLAEFVWSHRHELSDLLPTKEDSQ